MIPEEPIEDSRTEQTSSAVSYETDFLEYKKLQAQ